MATQAMTPRRGVPSFVTFLNPGADGRNGERQAEKKMSRAGEPLCQRVEENNKERDRCEESGHAVDRRACDKKSGRTERQKRPNDWLFHETMSVRRSWISLVKRPVAQPVEKHRGGARQNHTSEHEEQGS